MSIGPIDDLVRRHLDDPDAGWSVGAPGGIAEFVRNRGEPYDAGATPRGAIRIEPPEGAVAVAYRTPAGPDLGWNHAVAFCVPASATAPRRTVLTELGPDADAVRSDDRDGVLFDLGLGSPAVEACVRVPDPDVLRPFAGQPLFSSGAAALLIEQSPHRVFRGPAGRVEVFAAIPPPDGRSPDGPHTHLLPHLLGRTHPATVPVPDGTVPVAHLYPAHPGKEHDGRSRPYSPERDAAFTSLLDAFGDPALVELDRAVTEAVRDGRGPDTVDVPPSPPARATVSVTLRRLAAAEPDLPGLALWRPQRTAPDDERDPHGDRNGG
ncbi:DUF6925 family protein [Pseudonocardia endophytica]|uniref:Uncharacterized protein n=1 Tax=Pseudonocardia endophytica TaxID=401976 RepID=A0A4R1HKG1_PSEEN|nr:hypothetical protein [Pseudonocardia endophytica]TCK20985.1 hypothetical protein EV378_4954 [Pseudonocardia endophytica]